MATGLNLTLRNGDWERLRQILQYLGSDLRLGPTSDVQFQTLTLAKDDASTNTILDLLTLKRTTSGLPGDNIGLGISYQIETRSGLTEMATMEIAASDVSTGTQDTNWIFSVVENGTLTEYLRISTEDGAAIFSKPINVNFGLYTWDTTYSLVIGKDNSGVQGSNRLFIGGINPDGADKYYDLGYIDIYAQNMTLGDPNDTTDPILDIYKIAYCATFVAGSFVLWNTSYNHAYTSVGVFEEYDSAPTLYANNSHHLCLRNLTADYDITFKFLDGASAKTLTIDASENTFDFGDTILTTTGTITGAKGVFTTSGLRTQKSAANVSDPPTDAELDSAFGAPSSVGTGFVGVLDDNDAGTDVYLVFTTGTDGEWFYVKATKAL